MLRPLTFVVRAADGSVVDAFTEEELASYSLDPGKTWQEAAAWAWLAWSQWEREHAVG